MGRNLRSSTSGPNPRSSSQASGSEYHESDPMDQDQPDEDIPPDEPKPAEFTSRRGRRLLKQSYTEVTDEDAEGEPDPDHHEPIPLDDEDEEDAPRRLRSRGGGGGRNLRGFIASDDDGGDAAIKRPRRAAKKSSAPPPPTRITRNGGSRPSRTLRRGRSAKNEDDEEGYVDEGVSSGTADAELSVDNVQTTPEPEEDPEQEGRPYGLRKRDAAVNYIIPPLLEATEHENAAKRGRTKGRSGPAKRKGLGWSANGAELGQLFGLPMPGDDSVCNVTRVPARGLTVL